MEEVLPLVLQKQQLSCGRAALTPSALEQVLGQFASPAKRQKMCFVDDEHGGDACLALGSAAPSRLSKASKTTTPKPNKRWNASEPRTPGTSIKSNAAVAEDGLLAVLPEMLPANLMLLNQLLGALYVTIPLLKSRGKPTTYHNLRTPVQNFCGRDFQVQHVQQIKALCPEALGWEHVLTTNQTTKKQEQQLLLSLPRSANDPKKQADTAAMQHLFYQKLTQQHNKGCSSELPKAALPSAAAPSARDCTPSRRSISSQLLPGTPQTAPPAGPHSHPHGGSSSNAHLMMSPPPKRAAATCAKLGATAPPGLMSPPPARATRGRSRPGDAGEVSRGLTFSPMPRQPRALMTFSPAAASPGSSSFSSHLTPGKTAAPPAAAAEAPGNQTPALRPNKLFGTPSATSTPQQQSSARPGMCDTPAAATPAAAVAAAAVTPESGAPAAAAAACGVKVRKLTFDSAASSAAKTKTKSRSGIKFELGETAMALLKQVSSAEVQRQEAAQKEELDTWRALDMLPGSFDVLRGVFGDRGPSVKSKSEVLTLLRQKSTFKSGMSPADAAEQLELMLCFVPEFVRAVTTSGQSLAGLCQSVRINRQITWPAARQKMMQAAAQARDSGAAAAEAAVQADKEQEARDVAAAAEGAVQQSFPADDHAGAACDEVVKEAPTPVPTPRAVTAAAPRCGPSALDNILNQLAGSSGGGGSSSITGSGREAVAAEARALLGRTGASGSSKPAAAAMSGAMLSCLAFKAPLAKPCHGKAG